MRNKNFGERFKDSQKRAGISGVEIAAKLGKSEGAISLWRNGKIKPTLDETNVLAQLLKVSPSWLAYGEGPVAETEEKVLEAMRRFDPRRDDAVLRMIEAMDYPRTSAPLVPTGKPSLPVQAPPTVQTPVVQPSPQPQVPLSEPKPEPVRQVRPRSALRMFDAGFGRVVPFYTGLAAGPFREVEAADEPLLVDRAPQGSHALKIAGDSMEPTLKRGDVVLVRPIEGLDLPPIADRSQKLDLNAVRQVVRDGQICVVELEGEASCKRVKFQEYPDGDWDLILAADNPATPNFPMVVQMYHHLAVKGIVEGMVRQQQ